MLSRSAIRSQIATSVATALRTRSTNRGSLLTWGTHFFPDYFVLPFGQHHRVMDREVRKWAKQRGIRAAIEGPRGNAKSTVFTFLLPLYCACEGLEDYIIILGDTYSQAEKHVKAIQFELENNVELAEAYPHACGKGPTWNSSGIVTRNGIRLEPLGAGQKIRGRRERSARPSLIIIDDPEGDDAAYSATSRNTIREWATKAVMKAGNKRTNIIIVGTVIHRECLVAHCGRLPGWKRIPFKSVIKWPNRMDLWDKWESILNDNSVSESLAESAAKVFYELHEVDMNAGAEVLWPELESLYDLMFQRASEGHQSFESEKQNNPIDPSKCEWAPNNFEGDDIYFDEWPEDTIVKVMALDPSKGKKDKSGDYQAHIQLAVDSKGILYVDADLKHQPIKEMVAAYVETGRLFRPDVAVCEMEQFQELLLPEIEEAAASNKLLMPIEGIDTGKVPKDMRIRRLSPYITRRRIKYRRRSTGVQTLLRHMQDFPNGDHDDGPDALEMAVRRATELLADSDAGGNTENPY